VSSVDPEGWHLPYLVVAPPFLMLQFSVSSKLNRYQLRPTFWTHLPSAHGPLMMSSSRLALQILTVEFSNPPGYSPPSPRYFHRLPYPRRLPLSFSISYDSRTRLFWLCPLIPPGSGPPRGWFCFSFFLCFFSLMHMTAASQSTQLSRWRVPQAKMIALLN